MNLRGNITNIKRKILSSEVAVKILKNSSWLVGDKVFTMIIGVFVTAIVARYFGPETFGKYNYALSFVVLFTAFSTLGLETLTVKAIIDKDYDEGTILCTSLVLRILGGIIIIILSMVIIKLIEPKDINLHILVFILSLSMIFKALEVIEYWIQAYQKAKISSIIRMTTYILIAGLKIIMVSLGGTLIHYAIIYTIDSIVIGFALIIAYFKNRETNLRWKFNFKYAKEILSQSWYMILSSLMITLYMQMDKLMLGKMISTTEVGIYSAATSIAGMWYFIPMAIITSFKPVIMSKKKINETSFLNSVQLLYTVVTWLGIIFGVFILLFSNIIVNILYGPEYLKAASILSISVWAGTFAMLGSARSIWIVSEGLQRYTVLYIASGAIVNLFLNYILIPIIGGYGAAITTLVSQMVVAIISPFFIKETRISSIMMLKAFKLEGIIKRK